MVRKGGPPATTSGAAGSAIGKWGDHDMKINNINVIGIKDTVSRLRNTPADRWAITLDMGDWTVCGHGLVGQDFLQCRWPIVVIMGGHGNDGWGRDNPTMGGVKDKVREVMDIRARSRDDFARGCDRGGFASAKEEGGKAFFSTGLAAAGC